MNAFLVGDIHLADNPPRACTDKYTDNLLDMLAETLDLAAESYVSFVGLAGDIFHHKAPRKTSHELVTRLMARLNRPVGVVAAIGNHDLWHDNHERFRAQPLASLVASQYISLRHPRVYMWHWGKEFDPPGNTELVIAHQPIARDGEETPWENVPASYIADRYSGDVFYGHIHEDIGVWTHGDVTFCNHGALCRGTLSEADLNRTPRVTYWESGKGFQPVELESVLPVSELYDPKLLDAKLSVGRPGIDLDEWFAQLKQAGPSNDTLPTERAIAKIRESDLAKDVKDRAVELLESL